MNAQKSYGILLKKFDKISGNYLYQNADKIDYEQALWDGAQALEKQIPKKVSYGYDEQDDIKCPNCDYVISYMDAHDKGVDKYCSNCGQALDWSDTE